MVWREEGIMLCGVGAEENPPPPEDPGFACGELVEPACGEPVEVLPPPPSEGAGEEEAELGGAVGVGVTAAPETRG